MVSSIFGYGSNFSSFQISWLTIDGLGLMVSEVSWGGHGPWWIPSFGDQEMVAAASTGQDLCIIGPRGEGKTFLAQHLARCLGYSQIHTLCPAWILGVKCGIPSPIPSGKRLHNYGKSPF